MRGASLTRRSSLVYCFHPSPLRYLWCAILLLILAPALGYAQYDSDSDGLPDYDELAYIGTDPYNPDTDWDSMPDGWEYWNSLDPLSYDAENDPDGDNLLNYQEYSANTNPNYPDSDGDNMPDGWEVSYGLNPLSNDASDDPDGDGLTNLDEYLNSTNPFNSDTDGDYLTDYEEVYYYNTSPSNADSDNDGLTDSQELFELGTDPNDPDADNDGIPDGPDPNPFVAFVDIDSDGLPDAWEQLFFGNLAQSASER
jgi:clumping factor A